MRVEVVPVLMHNTQEVAERLRCSREHALRLIRDGRLRAMQINPGSGKPRWRVSEEDLQAFLAGASNKPLEAKPTRKKRRQREYYR